MIYVSLTVIIITDTLEACSKEQKKSKLSLCLVKQILEAFIRLISGTSFSFRLCCYCEKLATSQAFWSNCSEGLRWSCKKILNSSPPQTQIYTCLESDSSWRRTEVWLNSFGTTKVDHIENGKKDMVTEGTRPLTLRTSVGRDGRERPQTGSSAQGHRKNPWFVRATRVALHQMAGESWELFPGWKGW